ncbi:MAG: hypothetical protein KAS72_14770 [Phycisphaerales bacterium]|nr:hypothetical protein [Phycisphaerales bacterium]
MIANHCTAGTSHFTAAVAYTTFSGVKLLTDASRLHESQTIAKRFLVGIDWYRSEPSALDALQALAHSDVRIVDGSYLVSTSTCQPRRTYHPKAYLVKGTSSVLIVGSANLSRNGLKESIELSLSTSEPQAISRFDKWFAAQWTQAAPWQRIRSGYTEQYAAAKKRDFVVTDEDDIPDRRVLRIRWVNADPDRLRLLRAAQKLWIDVGGLHNRDWQGLPGTDLQFSQLTRVFFGAPARIVPGNTHLLDVVLEMAGAQQQVRPMTFNRSSSMDRLSLPVPGERGWPDQYDRETLLFTKSNVRSFTVRLATGRDRARWKRRSAAHGFCISMPQRQREWGVF